MSLDPNRNRKNFKILLLIGIAFIMLVIAGFGLANNAESPTDLQSLNAIAITNGSEPPDSLECAEGNHTLDRAEALPISEKGFESLGGLVFFTSLEEGLKEARSTRRPALVYFHSRSCGWCKKFESETLSDPNVISSILEGFVPIAIEVGELKKEAQKYRIYGTPTVVFLDMDGNENSRSRGYMDKEAFLKVLLELKENDQR